VGEGSAKREFCEAWVVALREKGELPSVKGGEKAEGEV
jgi:hypothetical protein